jgi:hypothetical protein
MEMEQALPEPARQRPARPQPNAPLSPPPPPQVAAPLSSPPVSPPVKPYQATPPNLPETAVKVCDYCKSPVTESARFCINCGMSLINDKKNQRETVIPWLHAEQVQMPKCSLTTLSRSGEPGSDSLLRFSGNVIQLNRGNTDPGNQTITSKIQAELCFENDKWFIQDKSVLKTTYIYAGNKTELKSGDIIVLGNRLFQFDCDTENI